jgi:hypothetical protein
MDAIQQHALFDGSVTSAGALKSGKKKPKAKKKKKGAVKKPSAAHYALYETAYDEPIEFVMARFQMVEEMLAESREAAAAAASTSPAPGAAAEDGNGDGGNGDGSAPAAAAAAEAVVVDRKGKGRAVDPDDDEAAAAAACDVPVTLTEKQLEILFKKTTFKPLSAIIKEGEVKAGDGKDWYIENDDDAMVSSSDGWSDDSSGERERRAAAKASKRRRREPREPREPRERRPRKERAPKRERAAPVIERMVTSQRLDESGRIVVLKKSVKFRDPTLPSLTRAPEGTGAELRKSGARLIEPFEPERDLPQLHADVRVTDDLLTYDLASCGSGFEGIYITPPWSTRPAAEGQSWAVTGAQLEALKIDDVLIPYGLVFMWVEKDTVRTALDVMRKWGFEYAEGYSAVTKRVNNTFGTQRGANGVFRSTKHSLIIGRKKKKSEESGGDQLELRHQRNPDVNFEFRKRFATGAAVGERSEFMYRIIETMLPKARYDEETGTGKFLQLWGNGYDMARPGWTVVCDTRTIRAPSAQHVV